MARPAIQKTLRKTFKESSNFPFATIYIRFHMGHAKSSLGSRGEDAASAIAMVVLLLLTDYQDKSAGEVLFLTARLSIGILVEIGLFPDEFKGLTAPIYTQSPFASRSWAPHKWFRISPGLKALYHIIRHILTAVRARVCYRVFAVTFFRALYFSCGH